MNRRFMFKVAAVGGAITALARGASAEEARKSHKLLLHVGANDREAMSTALHNAKNAHDDFAKRGETIEIEIVANSGGLHMLRDDTSPVKDDIRDLVKTVKGIAFSACNNTKMGMEKREGKTIPIISEARIVPAGIVRMAELQEQGYGYVRP